MNEWIYFISSIFWRFWINISITTWSTECNYTQVNKTVNFCPLQEFATLRHILIKSCVTPLHCSPVVFYPACTQFDRDQSYYTSMYWDRIGLISHLRTHALLTDYAHGHLRQRRTNNNETYCTGINDKEFSKSILSCHYSGRNGGNSDLRYLEQIFVSSSIWHFLPN